MPETPGRPAMTTTHPPHGTGPGGGACHRPVRGARRFRGTGLRGPVRIPPARVRRFARHGGVGPPSTVLETVGPPLSRWRVHCFRSSVFNHAMPAVSAAAWHGMRSRTAGRRNAFRRPSGFGRLRSAGPPGFCRSPSIQWDWPDRRIKPPVVDPPVCDQADSGGGRTRTSGVSLSQSYSLLPSPLGHATGASLLPVTVRCVPCLIHLYPQTVSLHKLMGDGSGSWSCRESNSGLACRRPLLAVTCVSDA